MAVKMYKSEYYMRRLVSVILVFIVFSLNMTACSNNKTDDKKVTISILAKNSWYTDVDYSETEIIKNLTEKSGYDIDWKLRQPNNYYDVTRELILNGSNLADIIQLPDLDLNMEYINTGKFVALDEYLQYMPNFQKFLNENSQIRASLTTDTGHIYYVPQLVLTSNYVPCIMYNMEWLEKVGKSVPSTLDEFVELLRIYKQTDINGNGKADEVPLSVTSEFLPYMFGPAFGLDLVNGFYVDENNNVKYSYYNSDNYKKYLEFVHGLYEEGLLDANYSTATRNTIKEQCSNNCIGVTFDYSWHMSMLYSAQYSSYDGYSPVFSGAKPLSGEYEGYYIGRNAISGLFGVTESDRTVDAVKLLDYMISEENETSYCFGIYNKSYVIKADGTKIFTDEAMDDTYIQHLGINPTCVPSRQSVEATDALLPEWHSKLDKELQKYVKAPFPLIYSTSEEAEQSNGYSNYIAKYVEQQSEAYILGKQSIDELDNFNAALKNMGIEDIIKLKQKQYNRYIKFLN